MSGPSTNTVTQQSQPPAAFMNAYTNLLQQANNTVANNPYQPYTGNIVAGLSPDQQTAIGQIQGTQGIAQPYINNAASYINQSNKPLAPTIAPETNTGLSLLNEAGNWTQAGASPVNASNIAQFENPYTQQVVQATQKEFANQNAQQQQQIQGQAAQQGAFGGDRQAVQAGITAGQQQLAQAPVIAGLESQGFNTALSAAMQQKQLEQQAGQGLTSQAQGVTGIGNLNLGANEANNWLASQAGYGMANLGNEALNTTLSPAQALLGVGGLEQQINQEQLNVPYQNYIAGQAYPFQTTSWLGGLTEGLGGAAGGSSSTTSPGASPISQTAGLGLTGLGIIGGTGGFGPAGWLTALLSRGGGVAGKGVPQRAFGGILPYSNVIPFRPRLPHPANDAFPHSPIRQAAVGGISQHFDGGGGVDDLESAGIASPFFNLESPGGGIAPDVAVTPEGFSRWQDSVPQADAGGIAPSFDLAPVSAQSQGIAPHHAGPPAPPPAAPPSAPAAAPNEAAAGASALAGIEPNISTPEAGTGGAQHGKMPWETLVAMGLGMMGGRSPNAMTNIGQGGLQGLEFGERVRAQDENAKLRQLQVQELADYRKQMSQTATDRLHQTAATTGAQQDIERAKLAQTGQNEALMRQLQVQDLGLKAAALNKGSWQPGTAPDPNDPTKTVSGMYYLPANGGAPQFHAGQTITSKTAGGGAMPPDVIDMIAQQRIAGDTTALQGLGYGAAGVAARQQVQAAIQKQLAGQGLTGADLAAKTAAYMGEKAGARTEGTREANVGMAVTEAEKFMPLALQASANVPRSQFPTLNSIIQAYDKGTGDENIVRLAVATNSLVNAYSRAITPSGIPTEGNQQRARELLDKAWSNGQYSTAVDQLWKEMQAAKASPIQVRNEQNARISGRNPNAGEQTPDLVPQSPATQSQIPHITDPAEARKLPKGSQFIDPNGVLRMVP